MGEGAELDVARFEVVEREPQAELPAIAVQAEACGAAEDAGEMELRRVQASRVEGERPTFRRVLGQQRLRCLGQLVMGELGRCARAPADAVQAQRVIDDARERV
jgi:hypothetical protein